MSLLSSLFRLGTTGRLAVCRRTLSTSVKAIEDKHGEPSALLKQFGRACHEKVKVESWETLWSLDGHALKTQGVNVKDRRYLLWALERTKQGDEPEEFAHPQKPKKKIRGWGPRVQNGKVLRSRRKRMARG